MLISLGQGMLCHGIAILSVQMILNKISPLSTSSNCFQKNWLNISGHTLDTYYVAIDNRIYNGP